MAYHAPVYVSDYVTPYLLIRCRCGHRSVLDKAQVVGVMQGRGMARPRISEMHSRLTCQKCGQRGGVDIAPVPRPDGDRPEHLYDLDDYVRLEVRCGCGNVGWPLVRHVLATIRARGLSTEWDKLPTVLRCQACGSPAASIRVLGRDRR